MILTMVFRHLKAILMFVFLNMFVTFAKHVEHIRSEIKYEIK